MRPLAVIAIAAFYFDGGLLLGRVVLVESFQALSTTTTTSHCRQHQLVTANYDAVVKRRRIQQSSPARTLSPPSLRRRPAVFLPPTLHRHHQKLSSLSLTYNNNNDDNNDSSSIDPLITRASLTLRASSWVSWWSQLILTVISTVTFLFARNVLVDAAAVGGVGSSSSARVLGKFVLPGAGIALSSLSIVWTWGQRRLARRLVRQLGRNSNNNSSNNNSINNNNSNSKKKKNKSTNITQSKVNVANLLRRTIRVGCILNLLGLLTSIAGAQVIVGTLAAKSMQVFVAAGSGVVGGGLQTLQPLDVLIVQANTNILSSHFVSLACLLYLTRIVDALDPPSLEDDDDDIVNNI